MPKSNAELKEMSERIARMTKEEGDAEEKKYREAAADFRRARKLATAVEGKKNVIRAFVYGRYVMEKKPEQFKEEIATSEFIVYASKKKSEREAFGFEPLEEPESEKKN